MLTNISNYYIIEKIYLIIIDYITLYYVTVESNETLYGNDDKYIEQVNEISKTLMQNIITEIDSIKENKVCVDSLLS